MSAGVGLMPTPSDGDALYRLADRALYEAKQNGRNMVLNQDDPRMAAQISSAA